MINCGKMRIISCSYGVANDCGQAKKDNTHLNIKHGLNSKSSDADQ